MAEARKHVRIRKRGDRGFHEYGDPMHCTYGTDIAVYESSAAAGPHVWLKLRCDPRFLGDQPGGEGTAHLNKRQALALIARLQTWVDEIPSRWGRRR